MTQTIPLREQIEQRLIELMVRFGATPQDITREAELEALGVDSLDLVELAQVAEEEFGVTLETDAILNLKTVEDAFDLVVERASS